MQEFKYLIMVQTDHMGSNNYCQPYMHKQKCDSTHKSESSIYIKLDGSQINGLVFTDMER